MKPFVWSIGGRWYVSTRLHPTDPFRYWRHMNGFEKSWFPSAAAAGDAVRKHLATS
jgi:hypothetical protein